MKRPTLLAILLAASGCRGPEPPPKTLLDADRAHEARAVIETETTAPQAKAAADALRQEAWQLSKAGRNEEASVVAEQASAGYELAIALGRRAQAEARVERARDSLEKKKVELALLETDQTRLEGEIEALELRARVQQDQQGIGDVEKLTPERAQARRRAALVLASEAEALCVGSRLLGAPEAEYRAAESELGPLIERLTQGSADKDVFPKASALRARCLELLTRIRVRAGADSPESEENDRFLEEATALELPAVRDDRGLVLRLTNISRGNELESHTTEQLKKIGSLALNHKDFPVLLVVHSSAQTENQKAKLWGETAKKSLESGGAPGVVVLYAGASAPLVHRRSAGALAQNRRLEVVFVNPRL
jgi:hypothetical protein